ncbi:hypothetical protein C9374_004943 [Naegleria lovaniensis]|uniref:Transmembrane protein n=1 Tax=Naegleria lovaniensis TaxID=51637 RepID=A0AA88GPM7_NAELO|nr:uncharacterized protein C9374_004943 [Naegleria lovaniensis]KAG2382976.1 hypothetical protein C9374_004943 [Naegleria lovaniensis]
MFHRHFKSFHHPLVRTRSTPTLCSSSSSKFIIETQFPILLMTLALLLIFTSHCLAAEASPTSTEYPSNVDFDPHDAHKTTFCTCQCCKDTMCNTIPNATFAVASCFECTKFVCDALGYECKTTLYRALCVQKNDIISQILVIIVFAWIFSMVIAAIVKAYLWPLIQKLIKRIRMKYNRK